jgi:NDP-sugar pyrophosphorylase family protein
VIAAILAAGQGTRMRPFTNRYPKPILPIGNKPLLQHQIELARDVGITEILLVIGHLGHEIAQVFGDGRALGVKIRYIEQSRRLGIAAAVGQLEPYVDSPLLLMLGDIFFNARNLRNMLTPVDEGRASAVLAVKREEDPEAIKRNFAIFQGPDGAVKRVVEKPRHATTDYKGCGIYAFDLQVFDAIRRTPRTAMRDEYEITESIQIMIDDGLRVLAADVVESDVNLTIPADVLQCNLLHLDRIGRETLVDDTASIHPGAQLTRVVVGPGAVVRNPIRISNAVIFPQTVVSSPTDIDRFIVTPEYEIDCRALTETATS